MIPVLHCYASVLHLVARNDADVPASHGQYARAAFYSLIEQTDPDLATWLHDKNARKEFTVSPLMDTPKSRNGTIRFRAGDMCALRFTLIGRRLFTALSQGFIATRALPQVHIGDACFEIASVCTTTGSHPWAGAQPLDALVHGAIASAAPIIKLQFVTPTRFNISLDGEPRAYLVPTPEWVFGNLLHKWQETGCDEVLNLTSLINDLAPLPADAPSMSELHGWRSLIAERVLVREMRDVNTQVKWLHNKPHIGFVGAVAYQIFGAPRLVQALNVLADAAFYFGVGSDTPMGMGQVRRLRD